VYITVYVDALLFIGEPEEVTRIFKEIQTKMLLRHTGTCTTGKTVDFLGRRITNKGDHFEIHSTAATPTTYYKKPTYSRRHQQLATPGATTSTSTPEQEELLDKQKTCPIQTLGRKATMALIHTT